MDDISQILNRSKIKKPDLITNIKSFVMEKYKAEVKVSLKPKTIIISSESASLINSLRLNARELINQYNITETIIFRIG